MLSTGRRVLLLTWRARESIEMQLVANLCTRVKKMMGTHNILFLCVGVGLAIFLLLETLLKTVIPRCQSRLPARSAGLMLSLPPSPGPVIPAIFPALPHLPPVVPRPHLPFGVFPSSHPGAPSCSQAFPSLELPILV